MSDPFFAIIIPIILAMWSLIAYLVWSAMKADALGPDFIAPAGIAALASFLFCGPFCIVVWYVLLLRAICLSSAGRLKGEFRKAPQSRSV